MKLKRRFATAFTLGGAVAVASRAAGGGWTWLVPVVAVYVVWACARNIYLSRFRLENDNDEVRLRRRDAVIGLVRWDAIAATQTLYPSVRGLLLLIAPPPPRFGSRSSVPPGFSRCHQVRRLLTLSPDLLLIGRAAEHLVAPLAALEIEDRLEFQKQLALRVPVGASRMPPAVLETAGVSEGAAQKKMLAREYEAAIPLYQEAGQAWQECGRMDQYNRVLQNMGECLERSGRHTDAAAALEESIKLSRNLRDERAEANALVALSRIQWALGTLQDLDYALKHLGDAIEIHERLTEPFFVARFLGNQAMCHERRWALLTPSSPKAQEALLECRRLANLALNTLGRPHPNIPRDHFDAQRANLLGTLARCAFMSGDWKAAAEQFAEAEKSSPGKQILVDKAMRSRALFLLSRNKDTSAGERDILIHQAMEGIDEAVRGLPMHGDYDESMEVLALRADAYWDLGRWEEAQRDYEFIIGLIERRDLPFSRPADRALLRRRYHRLFPRLVESCLRLATDDPSHAVNWFARAFQFSERFKARGLLDILVSSDAMRDLTPETRRELEAAQAEQKRAFLQSEAAGRTPDVAHGGWAVMGKAEEGWRRAVSKAIAERPELADLIQRGAPSLETVLARLPDDRTAVLQFSLCEGGLAVMLICRTAARPIYWLLSSFSSSQPPKAVKTYEAAYNAFANALEKKLPFPGNARKAWINALPGLVRSVREDIFGSPSRAGSIAETLVRMGISRVALIPEGLLSRLPLHVGVPEGILVSLAPSSGVLLEASRRAVGRPSEMLLVDNPDGEMPGSSREVDAVQQLAERHGVAVTRLPRSAATQEAVLHGLRKTLWLHYSGHAFSDHRHPWYSHLDTAGGETDARTLLQSGAVRGGTAVIVNGCSSGVAPHDPAGEFAGLPAAFLALGCSVVVATLWEVLQECPMILMERFYERLLSDREPVAQALGSAISHVRRLSIGDIAGYERRLGVPGNALFKEAMEHNPNHPLHWAGFVVWGAAWTAAEAAEERFVPAPESGFSWRPLVLSSAQSSPQEQLDLLAQAKTAFEQKRYEDVLRMLEDALVRWGPNRHVLACLGEAHTLLGQADRSLEYDCQALEMDLNSPRAHYTLGCTYMDLARVAEARECFHRALTLDPGYWKAMCNLCSLGNDPHENLAWLRKGFALEQRDLSTVPSPEDSDTSEGIAHWEKIAADPSFELAPHRIFWAGKLIGEKDWKHAQRELTLAKELLLTADQKHHVLNLEAEVFRQTGKLRESIARMEEALELDATSPPVWNTLCARRYLLAIDAATPRHEAQALLVAAVDAGRTAIARGDYSMPHRNMGSAYAALNDTTAAKSEALRALDMAQQQIRNGPQGELVCPGCATRGKAPAQCQECLTLSKGVLRDIELIEGNYRV